MANNNTVYDAFDHRIEAVFGAAFDPVPFLGGVALGALAVRAKNDRMLIFGSADSFFSANDQTFHQLHSSREISQGVQPFSFVFGAVASNGATAQVEATIQQLPIGGQVLLQYRFERETSFIFNSANCQHQELRDPGAYCRHIANNPRIFLEAFFAKSNSAASGFFRKPKYVYVAVKAIFAVQGIYLEQVNNANYQNASVDIGISQVAPMQVIFSVQNQRSLNAGCVVSNNTGFTIGVVWYKVPLQRFESETDPERPESARVTSSFPIQVLNEHFQPGDGKSSSASDKPNSADDTTDDDDDMKPPKEGFIKSWRKRRQERMSRRQDRKSKPN